jgi:hypothetical protein
MSTSEPPWDPNDTGGVPVGPEPEPTGAGGAGSGGWSEAPRTEPFAVAALVWAIVSVVLPIVGTIVAFVLAARAADSIKRSQGSRSGTGLVLAARVVAGAVIAIWAIGLVAFLALRDGDADNNNNVAVPTQPSTTSTSGAPTTTQPPLTTTTTKPPVTTTTLVAPTTSIVPPPPTQPTTPPTQPTTPPTQPTEAPTTTTTPPTTSTPPTTTTRSPQEEAERIQDQLLKTTGNQNKRIGPSDRGLTDAERVTVTYVPGQTVTVTWGINNGDPPLTGTATCQSPPATTTTTTTTSTTGPGVSTTTTTTLAPSPTSTPQVARKEARAILNLLKSEIAAGDLDLDTVQLIGTYPIEGASEGDVDVVQTSYTKAAVSAGAWAATKTNPFVVPPASEVQCLNPAFA